MKLLEVRIKNFRSIIDSGTVLVEDSITLLAGKNASGKTSFLEAIEWFLTGNKNLEEISRGNSEPPEVECLFEIPPGTDLFGHLFNVISLLDQRTPIKALLSRSMKGFQSSDSLNLLTLHQKDKELSLEPNAESIKNNIETARENLFKYINNIDSNLLDDPNIQPTIHELDKITNPSKFKKLTERLVRNIGLPVIDNQDLRIKLRNHLHRTNEFLTKSSRPPRKAVNEALPVPVFFPAGVVESIPNTVPIDSVDESPFFKLLKNALDINLSLLGPKSNPPSRNDHISSLNEKISKKIGSAWKQDEIGLKLSVGHNNLDIHVYHTNKHLKPSQWSTGTLWFVWLYINILAKEREKISGAILLLDDPAIHLHALAQVDVLEAIDQIVENPTIQAVITSHSPYFFNTEKLERVRFVEKDETNGTKIKKLQAGCSPSRDTLTPIFDSLGWRILGHLPDIKFSIIVEGISDLYYLKAFIKLSDCDYGDDWRIIPAMGSSKVANLASLIIGLGDKFPVVLLDPKEKKLTNKLRKFLGVEVVHCVENKSCIGIEDIFHPDDFEKHILQDAQNGRDLIEKFKESKNGPAKFLSNTEKNSRHSYKFTVSKLFFDKTRNGEITMDSLEDETKTRIQSLLKRLDEAISKSISLKDQDNDQSVDSN